MKINRYFLFVGFVVLLIALILAGMLYIQKQLQANNDKLVELYLKHSKSTPLTDTIRIPVYYKVPEIKVVERPVVVKEYLKDTLARSELDWQTLILSQKLKLDLFNRPRSFNIVTIDTSGKILENFYKVPFLTKEIKINSMGQVEYKKRKLIGLKIATGILVGTLTYTKIKQKL